MGIRSLCLFDLDNTLLKTNSSFRFGAYLYKHREFNISSMLYFVGCYSLHKTGMLPLKTLHHKIFRRLFYGHSASKFSSLAEAFITLELESMMYPPAISKLKEALQAGHHVGILSSSPDFLVELIAKRLGVERWMGTKYTVDSEGRFSTIIELMDGEVKAYYLNVFAQQLSIPPSAVIAYSDSILDRPFLEAAGHAVGVNPDKKLRRLCQQKRWEII